jgi:hypothetical protein
MPFANSGETCRTDTLHRRPDFHSQNYIGHATNPVWSTSLPEPTLYELNNQATTSDESNTVAPLVSARSATIEESCRHDFVNTTYDELYSGRREKGTSLISLMGGKRGHH